MGKMKRLELDRYDKGYACGYYDALAELTWECGDCGNIYESSVQYCPNNNLDKAIVSLKKQGISHE